MKRSNLKFHIYLGVFGFLLGYTLLKIGFADFGEVHRLFIFQDIRMLLSFVGAVLVAGFGFLIFSNRKKILSKPYHKGIIPGSVLFGTGWAITGACPAIVMVQLGNGTIPALATAGGIILGVWLFRKLQPRFFRWDTGSCDI